MLRIAILATHPIQYQAPLFRALAARNDVTTKVFFCWDFGVKETIDPGFGRAFTWDIPLLDGYDHELIPNLARKPGAHHFFGLLNPAAPKHIRSFRPDALVIQGYSHFTDVEVLMTSRLFGIPTLIRGDSSLLHRRPPHILAAKQLVLRPLFKTLAGALSSGRLNTQYYAHYGIPRERIFHAPFTVDNRFFWEREPDARNAARALRAEIGIAESDLVALFAAKLLPHKGCADLIRAFGAHPRENAHLAIVGDGPAKNEYVALAEKLAPGRIHFLGFFNQQRMPTAYALGDVFILPSHFEPWGLTINEAMCLGLPVIASDQCGAVPDLVLPDNGWVFPSRNVAALTSALDAAFSDRQGLARKAAASRKRMETWDIPQTAEGFVQAARAVSSNS
ncbi:MAG TPA: glycosyltransferase family 4 protein [Polyangium sp.]|nr:glycosyltransferase family 4 protein [Polyangium sp.]